MINLKNEKSFCILPWKHSFVNLGGEHQVCCTSEEFNNNIRNEKGDILNIKDNLSQEQIMNSSYMKNIRREMLNGVLPDICKRCSLTEKTGGVSRREIENSASMDIIPRALETTSDDGKIVIELESADYRLANICNLSCRMCNPRASSKWLPIYESLSKNLKTMNDSVLNLYSYKDWSKSDSLHFDFINKVKSLKRLHFGGGEPLYNKEMTKLLKYCVEQNYAKNIELSYNTNLTFLSDEIMELWKEFKNVKLLVSIDGYADLNHYIRYPSNWGDIDKYLCLIDQSYKELNISEVIISTTVQMNNILHLDKLFKYVEKFNFIKQEIHLVPLYFPTYLMISNLPKSLKYLASLKLDYLEKMLIEKKYSENAINNLKQIKSTLNVFHADSFEVGFNKFLQFSIEYDSKMGLNQKSVNPEFHTFYK